MTSNNNFAATKAATTCLNYGTPWESRVKPMEGATEGDSMHYGFSVEKEGFSADVLFQKGTVPEAGHNGVTIEELLTICGKRLAGLQEAFGCAENFAALALMFAAREALTGRTERRIDAKMKGTHAEAEAPYTVPFSHPAIAALVEERIISVDKLVTPDGARVYTIEMLPGVPEFNVGVQATYWLANGDIGDATEPPEYLVVPPTPKKDGALNALTIQCGNPKEVGLNGTNLTAAGIIKLCEADRLNYGSYPHWANDVTIWAECASLRAQGERLRERFGRGVLGVRTE